MKIFVKISAITWKVTGSNNDCDSYIVSFIILRVEVETYSILPSKKNSKRLKWAMLVKPRNSYIEKSNYCWNL